MTPSENDAGTIQALLEDLANIRLPRVLAIKRRVDEGERLTNDDLAFLKRILADGRHVESMIERHPEYRSLVSRLVGLYDEITRKALENEQRGP